MLWHQIDKVISHFDLDVCWNKKKIHWSNLDFHMWKSADIKVHQHIFTLAWMFQLKGFDSFHIVFGLFMAVLTGQLETWQEMVCEIMTYNRGPQVGPGPTNATARACTRPLNVGHRLYQQRYWVVMAYPPSLPLLIWMVAYMLIMNMSVCMTLNEKRKKHGWQWQADAPFASGTKLIPQQCRLPETVNVYIFLYLQTKVSKCSFQQP